MGRSMLLLLLSASIASLLAPGLKLLALAQQIPGFISIDCGAPNSYSNSYNDIYYETDKGFTDSGENKLVSTEYFDQDYVRPTKSLRSFPNGTRNCYTLKPDRGKNSLYLIRAHFWYGNYDGKNEAPTFDLHIDVNHWATVNLTTNVFTEMIYVPRADYIQVCVVNMGSGIPFISVLELRVLDNSIYGVESGFLKVRRRYDMGTGPENVTRYPFDVYDRIWKGSEDSYPLLPSAGASATSLSNNSDNYKVPGEVLLTAVTGRRGNSSLSYRWTSSTPGTWILYFYFAEIQSLPSGQQREFTVSINGNQFTKIVTLEYLKPVTIVSTPVAGSHINMSIIPTSNESPYLPILNAIEVYKNHGLPNVQTAEDDVKAINDTKATYGVNKESWQGDPCVPRNYTWDGLNCSYGKLPRIISLNLSSSNLRGNIHSPLSNLSELEALDLSNNELTGAIPETLANLPKLRILNLSGNKLNGSIPEALKRRVTDKTLDLSSRNVNLPTYFCCGFNNNPDLCWASPCPKKEAKTKNSILVPLVASVLVVVVVFCLVTIWIDDQQSDCFLAYGELGAKTLILPGFSLPIGMVRLRSFDYGEITRITRNFGTEIGEGGFGKVYLGTLENGTKVAVKMLSKKSWQGDREFQAEEKHLMIVHHGNLVSLHGYCDHSENRALVYEYMANGNLQQHLHGDKPNVLTWKQRLHIIVDVAKGLEYLHNGCDPTIIHRDLKATNILLNEKMQAKISDFGLSRTFIAETDAQVSTCAVGTPGYLDPDAHVSTRDVGTPGYLDLEYHSTKSLNKKSDVFSLGIILLELITGHPAMMMKPEGNVHILNWANSLIESKHLQKIMDPKLKGEFDSTSAWKAIRVAESCTKPTGDQRPDIDHVLAELKDCLKKALEPEKSPEDGEQNEKVK
ncbi:senescence-induced receptor-like serine/threonine-protein kinase [Eucalyptus grandis]|uniref:senescence-induced receptor-like serine/threonine-protein kinase n=1 Tax=Eucalyptus grandis TaxID=71139 RepID=UPI00192EA272|nr:senescence-induced receptor-like serine/threonine-protein kinase [Eucalyptus grandis]